MVSDFTVSVGNAAAIPLDDQSVDAIVTDPPYGISFMGKRWDYDVPSVEIWKEALRVLKPGGYLLAFSSARTYHRMVVAIEDAGFEIRDQIMWLYGSGFPKSLDVGQAIDKAGRRDYVLAAVRLGLEVPGNNLHDWTKAEHSPGDAWWERFKTVLSPEQWGAIEREVVAYGYRVHRGGTVKVAGLSDGEYEITAPATDSAREWEGWGTALKPAHEPICVARKPLNGTVAANVLEYGTGALNIDGCRIGVGEEGGEAAGRWPANVILDEEAAAMLDEQTGILTSGQAAEGGHRRNADKFRTAYGEFKGQTVEPTALYGDSGGASRFFYVAKADRAERERGLEGMPLRPGGSTAKGFTEDVERGIDRNRPVRNHHPTVKPVDLMRHLVRLVTPPGGLVLDQFMGSGTTGIAAVMEGFRFYGIDREPEYVEISRRRIGAAPLSLFADLGGAA
jgi:predicted RNA methylase